MGCFLFRYLNKESFAKGIIFLFFAIFYFSYLHQNKRCRNILRSYFDLQKSIIDLNKEENRDKKGFAIFFVNNPSYPIIFDKDFDYKIKAASYQRKSYYLTLKTESSLIPTVKWTPDHEYVQSSSKPKSFYYARPFAHENIVLSNDLFAKQNCLKPCDLSKIGTEIDPSFKMFNEISENVIYDNDYNDELEYDIVNVGRKKIEFTEFSYDSFTVIGYYQHGVLSARYDSHKTYWGTAVPGNHTFWQMVEISYLLEKDKLFFYRFGFIIAYLLIYRSLYGKEAFIITSIIIAFINSNYGIALKVYNSIFYQDRMNS